MKQLNLPTKKVENKEVVCNISDFGDFWSTKEVEYVNKQFNGLTIEKQYNAFGGGGFWVTITSPMMAQGNGKHVPWDYEIGGEYETNDVVYSVANVNIRAIAASRWRLYGSNGAAGNGSGKSLSSNDMSVLKSYSPTAAASLSGDSAQEIFNHPILDIFQQNNYGLNDYNLRFTTAMYIQVFGGCYWQIDRGSDGIPKAIRVLPTQYVLTKIGMDLQPVGYIWQPIYGAVQAYQFDADEVIAFRLPCAYDPYTGRHPPLRSAYGQAQLASRFVVVQNAMLQNRARPDGMFIPKEDIGRQDSERFEQLWNQKFANQGNGKTLIAERPGVYVPLGYPPGDIVALNINKEARMRICNAFGVPEAILDKDATYANLLGALKWHAQNTILPVLNMIEATLNLWFVPMFYPESKADVFVAPDNPIPKDDTVVIAKVQTAISAGSLSINGVNKELGFDRSDDPDADKLPHDLSPASEDVTDHGLPSKSEAGTGSPPASDSRSVVKPEAPAAMGRSPRAMSKSIAIGNLLLKVNEQVFNGILPRSVAISQVSSILEKDESEVRRFVAFPKSMEGAMDGSQAAGTPPCPYDEINSTPNENPSEKSCTE